MKTTVKARKAVTPPKAAVSDGEPFYDLLLYVAGATAKSSVAFENLRRICEEHLAGKYRVTVVNLALEPQLAKGHQILAVPTLVRKLPSPIRKVIGDLSNSERVLVGLNIQPHYPQSHLP